MRRQRIPHTGFGTEIRLEMEKKAYIYITILQNSLPIHMHIHTLFSAIIHMMRDILIREIHTLCWFGFDSSFSATYIFLRGNCLPYYQL